MIKDHQDQKVIRGQREIKDFQGEGRDGRDGRDGVQGMLVLVEIVD